MGLNTGQTVYSQIMDLLSQHAFRRFVEQYRGNFKVKTFSCKDQYLCMAFAQLSYRESLRDIESCLRSVQSKLYHMGLRSDQIIKLKGFYPSRDDPDPLRRIRYYDAEKERHLTFLTNQLTFPAITISEFYWRRWQVELFTRTPFCKSFKISH